MASSVVEIANAALIKIGATTIISLDDNTREAKLCKLKYAAARDFVLRSHKWNCATKRTILAPLTEQPPFGWSQQFQLPADWLRTIDVCGNRFPFKIEGRKILAQDTVLELVYIYKVQDPNEFDILCADAIACYLAYELSQSLMQDASQRNLLLQQFDMTVRKAACTDGQEDYPDSLGADWLLEARVGGGSYIFQNSRGSVIFP